MVQLTVKTTYSAKDQKKADRANKFIGQGSSRSSTYQYGKDYGDMANCGVYVAADDVVFISAEGNRSGRLDPDFEEIGLAVKAGVSLITDNPFNRNRTYNLGERQVARYLEEHGYIEVATQEYSIWNKGLSP